MMTAGCSDSQIQAALRWASTEALEEYKKAQPEAYGGWLMRAERQCLTAVMAHNLPRVFPQLNNDERAEQILQARSGLFQAADSADKHLPVLAAGADLDAETAWATATVGGAGTAPLVQPVRVQASPHLVRETPTPRACAPRTTHSSPMRRSARVAARRASTP